MAIYRRDDTGTAINVSLGLWRRPATPAPSCGNLQRDERSLHADEGFFTNGEA
jgi:hypothetical protein